MAATLFRSCCSRIDNLVDVPILIAAIPVLLSVHVLVADAVGAWTVLLEVAEPTRGKSAVASVDVAACVLVATI